MNETYWKVKPLARKVAAKSLELACGELWGMMRRRSSNLSLALGTVLDISQKAGGSDESSTRHCGPDNG